MPFHQDRAVASIEFRVALRNRWLILATGVMTLFSLALTFSGASGLELKAGILTLAPRREPCHALRLSHPVIALLISYDSIGRRGGARHDGAGAGDADFARRVTRRKALGLIAVLAIAIAACLTISSAAAIFAYGMDMSGLAAIVRLGLTGLAARRGLRRHRLMISVASPRAGQAAAVAIGVWLVATVLYDLALLAAFSPTRRGSSPRRYSRISLPPIRATPSASSNLAGLEECRPRQRPRWHRHTLPFSPSTHSPPFRLARCSAYCRYFQIRRLTP